MKDLFNQSILVNTPPQSNFPFNFKKKFSARAGVCIPFFVQDAIPGDYYKISNSLFCRTMPLVAPMLQDFKLSQHYFFVPKRLLWRNFEKYYTGGADGTSQASVITEGGSTRIKNPELVMPYFYPEDAYGRTYVAKHEPKVPFAHNYDYEPGTPEYDQLDSHQQLINRCFAFNGSLLDYLRVPKTYCKYSTHSVEGVQKPYWDITNNAAQNGSQPIPYWYLDCYHLIMKQYYKDENIKIDEDDDGGIWLDPSDGLTTIRWYNDVNDNFGRHYEGVESYGYLPPDELPAGYFALFRRAWRKDYFTSLLPWAQRGEQAVMPMMSSEDNKIAVTTINNTNTLHPQNTGTPNFGTVTINGVSVPYSNAHIAQDPSDNTKVVLSYETSSGEKIVKNIDFNNTAGVDLSQVQLFSIRELRRTEALQRFLEKMARGGARFSEQIMSIFGVKTADARLNIPEYLGGCTQILQVDSIEQNSQTTEDSALGTLAGKGTSAGAGYICDYNVTEPGIIMGILSIMPRASYQQGLHRDVTRGLVTMKGGTVISDRFEEIWPDFAHIGEQAVLNKEIFFDDSPAGSDTEDDNDGLLGYQMRYAEAKCRFDEIHGQFAQQLDYWHAGRIFEERPHLNQDFIQCHPTQRIFANTDDDAENFLVEVDFDILASRPLPFFGEPKLVG